MNLKKGKKQEEMKNKNMQFKSLVTLEKPLTARETPTRRVIEIKLTAPAIEKKKKEHIPLNLALVIDRSGSMNGEKMTYVKQAARHVVSMLSAEDRVGVFIYDNDAEQVLPSLLMSEANRAQAMSAIDEIFARGMTNLSDGWLLGCEAVGEHQSTKSIDRVLLLSDGLANQGITSLVKLGEHAAALHERGVATSTFGVGTDFNENLLERMSNQGGGNFYFIENPSQITEIFLQELTELVEVSAKDVVVSCELPQGVSVDVLGGWRHEIEDQTLNIFLGDLVASQERSLYLIASLPASETAETVSFSLKVTGSNEHNQEIQVEHPFEFKYDSLGACEQAPLEKKMMERYGRVHLSEITREAIKLERVGKRHEAHQMMAHAIGETSEFLNKADLPVFERRRDRMETGMSEAERKRMHYHSYRRSRSRIDEENESSVEE